MNPNELESAFEQANAAGDFENAYAIEQQLKGLPQEQRSTLGEIGRQLGLTGRAIAGGAAQIAEPFTEPVRYLMNKALPGNPIGNIETATDEVATAIGVPEPQGALEEGVQSASRFATGFAAGGLAGKSDDAVLGLLGMAKRAKPGVSSTAELRGIANAAYETADNSGVVIKSPSFNSFVDNAVTKLTNEGFDATLHPRTAAALKRLQSAAEGGNPMKLQEMEILRRVVGIAGRSADADEVRVAGMLKRELDRFTDKLSPTDLQSGDPRAAMAALKTARDAWQRFSKSTEIENAIEIARVNAGANFTQAGLEHALRIQFKQIARNIVKGKARGWSPKEVAAIKHIASGGKMGNAMRILGKLAPTNPISMGITAGVGFGASPAAAAALAGIGFGAKGIASGMTRRSVDSLSEMAVRGTPLPKGYNPPEWLLPWLSGAAVGTDTQGNN